jgi:hypothetical protein
MRSGSEAGGAVRAAALALALVAVAGCSHLHWPWHRAPPPAPVPVHEVDITGAGLEGAPQYWKRNTLLVDLSAASGTGSITVKPAAGTSWPVRLALRITPGAIGVLEVQGAQRVSLPINPTPGAPIELELAPELYTAKTPQLTVSFGPAAGPPS